MKKRKFRKLLIEAMDAVAERRPQPMRAGTDDDELDAPAPYSSQSWQEKYDEKARLYAREWPDTSIRVERVSPDRAVVGTFSGAFAMTSAQLVEHVKNNYWAGGDSVWRANVRNYASGKYMLQVKFNIFGEPSALSSNHADHARETQAAIEAAQATKASIDAARAVITSADRLLAPLGAILNAMQSENADRTLDLARLRDLEETLSEVRGLLIPWRTS